MVEDGDEAVHGCVTHLLDNIGLHDVHTSAVDHVREDGHVVERQNVLSRLEGALAALRR